MVNYFFNARSSFRRFPFSCCIVLSSSRSVLQRKPSNIGYQHQVQRPMQAKPKKQKGNQNSHSLHTLRHRDPIKLLPRTLDLLHSIAQLILEPVSAHLQHSLLAFPSGLLLLPSGLLLFSCSPDCGNRTRGRSSGKLRLGLAQFGLSSAQRSGKGDDFAVRHLYLGTERDGARLGFLRVCLERSASGLEFGEESGLVDGFFFQELFLFKGLLDRFLQLG